MPPRLGERLERSPGEREACDPTTPKRQWSIGKPQKPEPFLADMIRAAQRSEAALGRVQLGAPRERCACCRPVRGMGAAAALRTHTVRWERRIALGR